MENRIYYYNGATFDAIVKGYILFRRFFEIYKIPSLGFRFLRKSFNIQFI
jgi:hypothetical protein